MAAEATEFVLGVDIGTTSVKASLVDRATRGVHASHSLETHAAAPLDPTVASASEQDVGSVLAALNACISRLPSAQLRRVTRIGIGGQMHGVVLWRRGGGGDASRLVTWQDGRCTAAFLAELPVPASHLRLSTGHGCATLFWLQRHRPELLGRYDRAGTVQDFVVATLCGLDDAVISVQNAASWGYVDTEGGRWNETILSNAGFPVHLLPKIIPIESNAGTLTSPWYGIPAGTPVGVALGDIQCSVLSTLQSDGDAILNISTSAQLAFIMPKGFSPPMSASESPIQFFPYFDGRYLAVAASLNGGNVLAGFVNMLQQWTNDLGLSVPEDKIWDVILSAAQVDPNADSALTIAPTLFGERHLPDQRASVSNINLNNVSLGEVTRSLCRGIIGNLFSMMPRDKLAEAGVGRILGTGSALLRNRVLQKELEDQLNLPVAYLESSDEAFGAALAAIAYSDSNKS